MSGGIESWKSGRFPGQHLWGLTHLNDYGIDVEILPLEKFSRFTSHWRTQNFFRMSKNGLVSLDQQIRSIFKSDYDLIYSACQTHTSLLSKLRSAGLFKKPIVATVHHPLTQEQLKNSYINGHDKLLFLSEKIKSNIEEIFPKFNLKFEKIDWGVDLPFYQENSEYYQSSDRPIIISAGKSNRDYSQLAKSVDGLNCSLKVYCSERCKPTEVNIPDNCTVKWGQGGENAISYRDLLREYSKSSIIVIPLKNINALAGLTSLLEAMAMGRPIIMTKNPYLDIDIEREGIGQWVSADNEMQWREKISYFLDNPDIARDCGLNAYRLCKEKYNMENYGSRLADIFYEILKK